jgi:hypothetical protein
MIICGQLAHRFHASARSIFAEIQKYRSGPKIGIWRRGQADRINDPNNRQYIRENRMIRATKFPLRLIRRGLQPETLCYGDSESIRPQSVKRFQHGCIGLRCAKVAWSDSWLWPKRSDFWGIGVGIVIRM